MSLSLPSANRPGSAVAPAARVAETVIEQARPSDEDRVTTILARAFDDDPMFRFLVPGEGRRRALRRLFRTIVRQLAMPHGEVQVTTTSDATAVWQPPGTEPIGPRQQLRLLPEMIAAVGLRGLPRLLGTMNLMEAHHPRQPHFYLMLLGVAPDRRGRGIGSTLLREVLDRCDRDGVPVYLEASSPRNVPLYERHGFAVSAQLELPGGGPPFWPMWREPAGH